MDGRKSVNGGLNASEMSSVPEDDNTSNDGHNRTSNNGRIINTSANNDASRSDGINQIQHLGQPLQQQPQNELTNDPVELAKLQASREEDSGPEKQPFQKTL